MPAGGGLQLAGGQVEEPQRAVLAADRHRAVVAAERVRGRQVRIAALLASGKRLSTLSVAASRTVTPSSPPTTSCRPSVVNITGERGQSWNGSMVSRRGARRAPGRRCDGPSARRSASGSPAGAAVQRHAERAAVRRELHSGDGVLAGHREPLDDSACARVDQRDQNAPARRELGGRARNARVGDSQTAAVRAVGQREDRPGGSAPARAWRAPPGPRVEEEDLARMFPTASVRPSGLTAALRMVGAVRAYDADRGRAARAARRAGCRASADRVVERDALAGQQQRAVELGRRAARGRRVAARRPRSPRRARCRAGRARRRRRPPRATSSAATPASTARSRRCERSLAVRLWARNARSVALSSASWSAAQSSAEASRAPR